MHEPLFTLRVSIWMHWQGYAAALLLVIGGFTLHYALIGLALLVWAAVEVARRTTAFVLYEDGVAREFRFLSTSKVFMEYESIEDFTVTQSLFERLIKAGTVHLNTAGSSHQEIVFRGLPYPDKIETFIRQKMQSAQARAGMHIASAAPANVDTAGLGE